MWIPECNNHGQSGPNSLPLILPKPFSHNTFSTTPTHCFYPHNLINIPAWNKPLSGLRGYGGKGEVISTVPPLVSSRWNPTPEQLQALEEMYRRGIKTPSAQQIQQIAAKLRRFGKIEGKNVFYWFQNHKARERQKRRRQMELSMHICERPERRQSGQSRRYLETKHPKKLPTPSTCSTALEYSVSMEGEECEQDKWSQLDCREPQQHNRTAKNITEACCPLDSLLLSYCMPLNNNVAEGKAPGQENEKPFVALDGNILLASENDDFRILENGILKRSRTLQLFPVGRNGPSIVEEKDYDVSNIGTKLVPNQFFEFLPTKY